MNLQSLTQHSSYFWIKQLINPPYLFKPAYQPIKQTKLNNYLPLFLDRHLEFIDFYNLNKRDLISIWQTHGFPHTKEYSDSYMKEFEKNTSNYTSLKDTYAKYSQLYAYRLMMAYERYTLIAPYIELVSHRLSKIKNPVILDYGCGVADISLTLSLMFKAQVHIVDLDDSKLKFAESRFKRRNLEVKIHALKDVDSFPQIPKNKVDIIIATELLEHVPDPLNLTKKFYEWLKPKGILFNSMGSDFERNLRGDHLQQALEIGNSKKYRDFYTQSFRQIKHKTIEDSWLFEKI